MHTLHHIAVEEDSSKDAFYKVKSFIEKKISSGEFWSDWAIVGGGRWSKNSKDGYEDTIQDVLSYAENVKKFTDALNGVLQSRKEQMQTFITGLQGEGEALFMIKALEYARTGNVEQVLDLNSYYFLTMSQMISGYWNPDTFFYDMEESTSNIAYLRERLNGGAYNVNRQYLVPVDFHF